MSGDSPLGEDGILGASGAFSAYAFEVSTLRMFAREERRRTRTIVDYLKPARTYLARLVQSWGSPSSTSAQRSSSQANQNLAADLGFVGVVANAVVSQHAPMPDLTMDIFFSALENVDASKDENGVSTGVSGTGKEKTVSVFVKFDRALLSGDP